MKNKESNKPAGVNRLAINKALEYTAYLSGGRQSGPPGLQPPHVRTGQLSSPEPLRKNEAAELTARSKNEKNPLPTEPTANTFPTSVVDKIVTRTTDRSFFSFVHLFNLGFEEFVD